MTKYLGEEGDKTVLSGAVSISNPFDLYQGSLHLQNNPFHFHIYSKRFAQNLKNFVKVHYDAFSKSEKVNVDEILEKVFNCLALCVN